MLLALRLCRIRVLPHPTTRPLKRSASVLPLAGGEKSAIAFLSIRLVIRPWTNKRAVISHSAVFPKLDKRRESRSISRLGESRQSDGATTSPARGTRRQTPLRRDSRQSRGAGHDLFAAFSCGGFLFWIVGEWNRRRRERRALQHRLRCVICAFEFEDRTDALLPRCPRCGSLNERFKNGANLMMGMWIGRNRKARVTYGFDEIALVPGRVTINPNEVDITCRLPRKEAEPLALKIPILASAMDGVVDVRFAIAMSKLGGLGRSESRRSSNALQESAGSSAKNRRGGQSRYHRAAATNLPGTGPGRFNRGARAPDQRRRRAGRGQLHSAARG